MQLSKNATAGYKEVGLMSKVRCSAASVKTCPHKNLHFSVAALIIIAKTWKQPRRPSVGERMTHDKGVLFGAKEKAC